MEKDKDDEYFYDDGEDGVEDEDEHLDEWAFLRRWADALENTMEGNEGEDTPFLSEEELEKLKDRPHVFDYKFSQEEKEFLDKNGYLVVKGVVPKELCERMVDELWQRAHLLCGARRDDPSTWQPLLKDSGFIDIWHNPTYYKIRELPQLYAIFAQLLRDHDLTVGMDRACLKPPGFYDMAIGSEQTKRVELEQRELLIHNDMNLWDLKETMYQGGIALSNCSVGGGGFRCIPGFHKLERIRAYREQFEIGEYHGFGPQPPPSGSFVYFLDQDAIKNEVVEVQMEMGDFVIWNSRLPHANALNKSPNWRLQCYVRFMPTRLHQEYRGEVLASMKTGEKPPHYSTGNNATGDTNRKWECSIHDVPELSWLGKRVCGEEQF